MSAPTTSTWKGLAPEVLAAAGVRAEADGLVHLPCRNLAGELLRERIVAPDGRRWWGAGEGVHLFGAEKLAGAGSDTPVLVCEGESDALAAREHLRGVVALGSPGAAVFRSEWRALLEGFAVVYGIGDGDDAGRAFAWRVHAAVPQARPVVCPEGRDLRDLLQAGERARVEALLSEADAMARLEHAVLNAPDLQTAALWLTGNERKAAA